MVSFNESFWKRDWIFQNSSLEASSSKKRGRGEITSSGDSHLLHAVGIHPGAEPSCVWSAGPSGCRSRTTTPSSASPALGGLCPPSGFQLVPIFSGCTVNICTATTDVRLSPMLNMLLPLGDTELWLWQRWGKEGESHSFPEPSTPHQLIQMHVLSLL